METVEIVRYLFATVFLLFASAGIYWNGKLTYWKRVEAKILTKEIVEEVSSSRNGMSLSYRPKVSYSYRVGEHEYLGENIGMFKISYPLPQVAEYFTEKYSPGTIVFAFVSPKNYGKAYLRKPSNWMTLTFLAISIIILVAPSLL